jgi:quinoprotein glucose dehydrogenase
MYQEVSDFYLLKKRPEPGQSGGRGAGGGAAFRGSAAGQIAYAQYCQTCHGADRAGTADNGGAPTLLTLAGRVDQTSFKSVLSSGRGRMPSFPHLEDSTVNAIYAYLVPPAGGRGGRGARGGAAGAAEPVIDGPVVASGGAPAKAGAAAGGGFGGGRGGGMSDYPEGYTGKKVQYVEAHNWGDNPGNILSPPWCGIAAYDLNKGIMKWRIGLGDDVQSGTKGLGLNNGTQNHGMLITRSGLVFATCKDGKLRAIDADNGKIIWEYDLGRDANGIPAVYEQNGREYLVVCATGGLTDKTKKDADVPKGYIAFALPDKK